MLVPALVLAVASLVVGAAGVLALRHRLPRNRVLGVRTPWTMSRVDTFRRANRAAAPAFLAAGGVGLVGAAAAAVSPSTVAAATLLALGLVGLLVLIGAAGVIGTRFAVLDEAEVRAAEAGTGGGGCCFDEPAGDADVPTGTATHGDAAAVDHGAVDHAAVEHGAGACAPAGCAGACELCPRAGAGAGARTDERGSAGRA